MISSKFTLGALALAALTGCASVEQAREQVARDATVAQGHTAAIAAAPKGEPNNIRQRPRIAGELVQRDRNALPRTFAQPFTYRTQGGQTLQAVAQNLAAQIGMPVRVLHTAGVAATANGGNGAGSGSLMMLDWRDKPLSGLLDQIAQQQGIFWRFTADRGVEFFELESRTFHVNVPSGVKKIESSISLGGGAGSSGGSSGSNGGSGGGSGGGSVNIASATEIDPYTSMMASIGAMLEADEGGRSGTKAAGGGTARPAGGSAGASGGNAGGAAAGGGASRTGG